MSFTLNEQKFQNEAASLNQYGSTNEIATMTMNWTIAKTAILFIIMLATALSIAYFTLVNQLIPMQYIRIIWIAWIIWAIILWLIMSFKPKTAPVISPVYAVLEWMFVAWVSIFYSAMFSWIVLQAVFATMAVFISMLVLYRTWVIVVNSRFKSILWMAVMWIWLIYLVTIVGNISWWFHIPFIHGSGPIWIWFSVIVVWIASLTLANEFDEIENWVMLEAPKYMEWYSAFSLLSAIVWLYIEILRLLAKIQSND